MAATSDILKSVPPPRAVLVELSRVVRERQALEKLLRLSRELHADEERDDQEVANA